MTEAAIDRILDRFREDREIEKAVTKDKWNKKTHREKAEALLDRVNPEMVFERDMPVLALAQVHATLSLTESERKS